MRDADIGIVGGGLAGAVAAAMLGRAGISSILIDTHQAYPPDFRCEKFDQAQLELLAKTGLAGGILRRATAMNELWVARFGRLTAKRATTQVGIAYDDMVNAARAEIPAATRFIPARVTAISTSADTQTITTSRGQTFSVRLVVLATGLNRNLSRQLNIEREIQSKCHSVSVGFDVAANGRDRFKFSALTYFGGKADRRIAYISLFPIKSVMRANLFIYRDIGDPWLRRLQEAPEATLYSSMPKLERFMGAFHVASEFRIRPVDLYITKGHRQRGVVMVGDAFATSCPAAGTGTTKVLTDVERLCNFYIPRWLASEGMDEGKIGAFYDDPAKIACDAQSTLRAYYTRSLALDEKLRWRVRRVGWSAIDVAGEAFPRVLEWLRRRNEPAFVSPPRIRAAE